MSDIIERQEAIIEKQDKHIKDCWKVLNLQHEIIERQGRLIECQKQS